MISPSVQAQVPSNQGLMPGDTVPDATLTHLIHGQGPAIRLSDLRGKLVIVDFWATWCSSCIVLLHHIDSLQKQFPDKLKILAVTTQDHDLITDFLVKNRIARQLSLTFVTDDTLLSRWFPHQTLPHEVWISPEGTVESITPAQEVTEAHILDIWQKRQPDMLQKKDYPYREPLFSADYLPKNNLRQYSILLKGYLPGTNKAYLHSTFGQVTLYGIVNRPLLDFYMDAARHFIPHFSRVRVIFETADSSSIDYSNNSYKNFSWVKQNLYTYEIVLPTKEKDSLFAYMLQDLNRYTNYRGKIETRDRPCLILKGIPGKEITPHPVSQMQASSSDSSKLYGFTAETVISWLMGLKYLQLPIVQETGYSGKLFIDPRHKPSSRAALQEMLATHGLILIEDHRPLPMLIISDKK